MPGPFFRRISAIAPLCAAAVLAVAAVLLLSRLPEAEEKPAEGPAPAPESAPDTVDRWVRGEIRPGQGMFQVLSDMGLDQQKFLEIHRRLSYEVEMLNLRVGEKLSFRWNADSTRVEELFYEPDKIVRHRLYRVGDSLAYEQIEKPTELRYRLVKGVLRRGSTLDQTLLRGGVHPTLKQVVNGVLLCKIAFNTQAREGDEFEVLLKEELFEHELLPKRAEVLYTRYAGSVAGTHEAFRYREDDPKSSYNAHYDESGSALVFSGLRYPLERLHVTSSYGVRRHPVTGQMKAHHGIDYRGRVGEPVYAVAPGTVTVSGFDPFSGNKVAIRHADGSESWYMHLSRRGVSVGSKVGSRQVIGAVGNTGRSTGPHLHLGFKEKGSWINPNNKRMIATPKLEGARMERLKRQIAEIRELLKSDKLVMATARDPRADRTPARARMPWETLGENEIPVWPCEHEGFGIYVEQ